MSKFSLPLNRLLQQFRFHALYTAWVLACIGTLWSIYYSYIRNIEPCFLCHYQRICLFPLCIILGIASYKDSSEIKDYVLPLPILGFCVAVYQVCLQEIPGMQLDLCGRVSCEAKIFVFGFITIPMASALAFATIAGLLWTAKNKEIKH
ncbi:disulfide bond formation protein B [Chlamydiifrater phoenicopteri]|uniref:disulfide bond formation protein B n=1 Tax=Chlamydiifrater phoenicopteri TaxID=2681469 RepID=UPI001BCF22D2|nr:disulfide bond formation protein B [Chlamydiifrater phoenicopteri]